MLSCFRMPSPRVIIVTVDSTAIACPMELMVLMTRLFAFSFASLLSCCCLLAQSPASAPAAAPVAVTSVDGTEVQQFQKIEDAWDDAINLRDQYALELVLSPLFVDVSAGGDITTRNHSWLC